MYPGAVSIACTHPRRDTSSPRGFRVAAHWRIPSLRRTKAPPPQRPAHAAISQRIPADIVHAPPLALHIRPTCWRARECAPGSSAAPPRSFARAASPDRRAGRRRSDASTFPPRAVVSAPTCNCPWRRDAGGAFRCWRYMQQRVGH